MFVLAWGDDDAPEGGELWRGVREPQRWVCRGDDVLGAGGVREQFALIGWWNAEACADAAVANFVIRVVTPESGDEIRRQLVEQADTGEGVLSRPGCLGLLLAAAVGQPEAMLGISYWPRVDAFDAYARWAQAAQWKDVITPVTAGVPLRLLAQRT